MGDRSEYSNDGLRGKDSREGFGDDMGTRVGRPDGAREASAGSRGTPPGQAGTNREAVPDGIEGSIMDDDADQARGAQERRTEDDGLHGSGAEQARVQDSARQSDEINRPAGDNRRVDDL
jgi:hypothetical protein